MADRIALKKGGEYEVESLYPLLEIVRLRLWGINGEKGIFLALDFTEDEIRTLVDTLIKAVHPPA